MLFSDLLKSARFDPWPRYMGHNVDGLLSGRVFTSIIVLNFPGSENIGFFLLFSSWQLCKSNPQLEIGYHRTSVISAGKITYRSELRFLAPEALNMSRLQVLLIPLNDFYFISDLFSIIIYFHAVIIKNYLFENFLFSLSSVLITRVWVILNCENKYFFSLKNVILLYKL